MKFNSKLFFVFFVLLYWGSVSGRDREAESRRPVYTFSVEDVVLNNSWICQRESLNVAYLKSLDVDRLLHNFRVNAGLPSTVVPLSGWEDPAVGLRGHFVGHFLSATSFVVKKYNDPILKERLRYMVDALGQCQSNFGNGYLSAFPQADFDALESGSSGVWAPYYTYHKIMQGLLDVYMNIGYLKAYDMVLGMADYVAMRMSKLDEATISAMLYTTQANPCNESGGMNEVLYRLYNLSKDKKYLDLAKIFDRPWFLNPLLNDVDILSGLHSNTHIALVNGFAECYSVTKDFKYYEAVANFWDMLISDHAYVNGSSSGPRPNVTTSTSLTSEHWGRPGQLSNTLTGFVAESCVSHNTQKLTARLFEWTCNPMYANAYMNTFYNSIMALQNDKTGAYVYHLPLGSPRKKSFLDSYKDFKCCNGSSIEAFSLLNNNIYFHRDRDLWVNMYIPTTLNWSAYGVKVLQSGDFIYDHEACLTLQMDTSQKFSIHLFIPSWSKKTEVYVNGKLQEITSGGTFFTLSRNWHNNDSISIKFDFDFYIKSMPDDKNMIAVFYGPLLLAFQDSSEISLYGDPDNIVSHLEIVDKEKLKFILTNNGDLYNLKPLLFVRDETYSVYVQTNKLCD